MIKVAVIGFGFMGYTHSLNILKNNKMKLQAIITRQPEKVKEKLYEKGGNFSSGEIDANAILNIPVYTSLQECLNHQKIDAVQICVHTDLHYEMTREAMELGLHVFLEKPISLSIVDGESLIHLARQKKVKFMVGHVVRFMPAYKKLKQWIDDKTFGSLTFISLSRFTGLPSWGQWKEKQNKFGSSGGALFDLVIHDIDFLNYALGVPKKISSVCLPGMLSNHDYVSSHWNYGEVQAKIEGGNIFHSDFPFQAGFLARFENASVTYSSMKPEFIQVCSNEKTDHIPVEDSNQGFYDEIDYFATCIEEDTEPIACMPESSVLTLQLCYNHI